MNEILNLINEMAPFLLLGFLLAGIMHAFVPQTLYKKYLSGKSLKTVIYAALLGIPLPLCSCGTIPTAMSLRKEGASKGATVSFLISTPQTGIDSITATYSLIGLPFALLRPIAALFTALLGGIMVNKWDNDTESGDNNQQTAHVVEENEKCSSHNDCCCNKKESFWGKIKSALHYAFVEMMQDIGRWLMLGLLVAGAITVFIPEEWFALVAGNSLLSMLIVLLFSLPMYICATGSIPIAAALMLKGLSPGAALVLLMAGPAVNAASMLVINRVLGKKALTLYILSVIGGAIAFGLLTDYLLPREWFTESIEQIKTCCDSGSMVFNQICTIVLILLMANALIHRHRHGDCCCQTNEQHSNNGNESVCVIDKEKSTDNQACVKTVYIDGMMCNHCKSNAEKAIRAIAGVEDVNIELSSGKTIIKGTASLDDIKKAVEEIGFVVKD